MGTGVGTGDDAGTIEDDGAAEGVDPDAFGTAVAVP